MRIISGSNLNTTIYKAFEAVKSEGIHQESRNGGATALYNNIFSIENPRSRHLHLDGRKSNIFALLGETLWVWSGANVLDPYLTFFLPRVPQYSDDGITWNAPYGNRLYRHDQINGIIDTFKTDGKHTRRAQGSIYDPSLDSPEGFASRYGADVKPRDIPCSSLLYAYVDNDDKFHLHVTQRSGDLLFGTGSINPFEFTFLQEILFNEVKTIYPEIILGYYSWYVNNAHIYDSFADQLESVLVNPQILDHENDMPLIGPPVVEMETFFSEILSDLSAAIVEGPLDDYEYDYYKSALTQTFIDYHVPILDNLLFHYVQLTLVYIFSKKYPNINFEYDVSELPDEVSYAIVNSKFRKFQVV